VGGPLWCGGDGDSAGGGERIRCRRRTKLNSQEIALDHEIYVFWRTVQTDDEIAEQRAADATTVIFEAETVDAFEKFSPSVDEQGLECGCGSRESEGWKGKGREGRNWAMRCTPDDEVHQGPANCDFVQKHLGSGVAQPRKCRIFDRIEVRVLAYPQRVLRE